MWQAKGENKNMLGFKNHSKIVNDTIEQLIQRALSRATASKRESLTKQRTLERQLTDPSVDTDKLQLELKSAKEAYKVAHGEEQSLLYHQALVETAIDIEAILPDLLSAIVNKDVGMARELFQRNFQPLRSEKTDRVDADKTKRLIGSRLETIAFNNKRSDVVVAAKNYINAFNHFYQSWAQKLTPQAFEGDLKALAVGVIDDAYPFLTLLQNKNKHRHLPILQKLDPNQPWPRKGEFTRYNDWAETGIEAAFSNKLGANVTAISSAGRGGWPSPTSKASEEEKSDGTPIRLGASSSSSSEEEEKKSENGDPPPKKDPPKKDPPARPPRRRKKRPDGKVQVRIPKRTPPPNCFYRNRHPLTALAMAAGGAALFPVFFLWFQKKAFYGINGFNHAWNLMNTLGDSISTLSLSWRNPTVVGSDTFDNMQVNVAGSTGYNTSLPINLPANCVQNNQTAFTCTNPNDGTINNILSKTEFSGGDINEQSEWFITVTATGQYNDEHYQSLYQVAGQHTPPSPSSSPTPSPSASPSPTPSSSVTPSASSSSSVTPSSSSSSSVTPSVSSSNSVSASATRSASPTPSITPTISVSASATPSPTTSPSNTASVTPSVSTSSSVTPSISTSSSVTPSISRTPTRSPSNTPSNSPSPSRTPTRSPTPSTSRTPTRSPTPSKTPSPLACAARSQFQFGAPAIAGQQSGINFLPNDEYTIQACQTGGTSGCQVQHQLNWGGACFVEFGDTRWQSTGANQATTVSVSDATGFSLVDGLVTKTTSDAFGQCSYVTHTATYVCPDSCTYTTTSTVLAQCGTDCGDLSASSACSRRVLHESDHESATTMDQHADVDWWFFLSYGVVQTAIEFWQRPDKQQTWQAFIESKVSNMLPHYIFTQALVSAGLDQESAAVLANVALPLLNKAARSFVNTNQLQNRHGLVFNTLCWVGALAALSSSGFSNVNLWIMVALQTPVVAMRTTQYLRTCFFGEKAMAATTNKVQQPIEPLEAVKSCK